MARFKHYDLNQTKMIPLQRNTRAPQAGICSRGNVLECNQWFLCEVLLVAACWGRSALHTITNAGGINYLSWGF